ncbi:MAG: hypothetical protein RLZZ312_1591 [Bacteroidota bacterium]|jgi:thiol-disulfide isomerase/thioredoxin/uncharacterized membrane protein YphA (DoxX/SURF4 family)
MFKKYLPITIRIIIAALFIVSALAKLYPSPYFAITTFEVKQLYTLGFSEKIAPFFSRILIGIEFALGLLLLSNHFLRRITIPATMIMLFVFTTHLSIITFFSGGNSGNCGCFGELLPMTPVEAIIKNVVAIALLVLYYLLTKNQTDKKSNFWILTTVTLGCILGVYMATFSQPKTEEPTYTVTDLSVQKPEIVPQQITAPAEIATQIASKTTVEQELKVIEKPIVIVEKSGYSKYFSDADNGQKIICFFVPGCDHCREIATKLNDLKAKNKNFPELKILFMDEEANLIPEFFEKTGGVHPYKIIDIIGFWKLLGTGKEVPGVKLLQDGKTIKYYYGTTDNQFNTDDFLSLLKKQ